MRISSLKNIALWQLPIYEGNEIQENEVSSLNWNLKFWLVLFYWGG